MVCICDKRIKYFVVFLEDDFEIDDFDIFVCK